MIANNSFDATPKVAGGLVVAAIVLLALLALGLKGNVHS